MTAIFLILLACTDTDIAHMKSIGNAGHITCYSGGQVIYDGDSTGKIATVEKSDGWEFMDAKTGRLVRVSGDCLIRN
jgi:hypothetical protein